MKKILCLIESLGSGGAERQITGLASMLKKQGHHVEVWYYIKNEFYLSYLLENGVEGKFIHDAINPRKRFFIFQKHINSFKPDTVVSYSASTNMIACIMKMFGATFNLIVSERNTTQNLTIREKQKFFLYRWANYIVPNSFSQGTFINNNFPKLTKKVNVITNFVDMDKFSPLTLTGQHLSDRLKLVCVGRMMEQKNIVNFIRAISKLVRNRYNIRVDWYGQDLGDAYSEQCHKLISENDLKDSFVFHAPSSKIQDEYRNADVFCLPSLYEGFPNVLCEAMSCGMPVLCSRVCDNPNIVKEGTNGLLFNPLSIDDIAMTIEKYILLPEQDKIIMGESSRVIALELFSKDKFLIKYGEII